MVLNEDHKILTDGVGKCSVPMWSNGCPAGFCDEPAYGEQEKDQERYGKYSPSWKKWFPGYCGGLACYKHGGPKTPQNKCKILIKENLKKDTNCPYCLAEVEINHDYSYGYEEEKMHQQQCPYCEKTFTYTTYTHFSYNTYKADCLNGGEHKYKKFLTIPSKYSRLLCEDCWHEIPLKKDENLRYHP